MSAINWSDLEKKIGEKNRGRCREIRVVAILCRMSQEEILFAPFLTVWVIGDVAVFFAFWRKAKKAATSPIPQQLQPPEQSKPDRHPARHLR